jgi:hypothetical protein
VVILGYGPVINYQALAEYINMHETVRERLVRLIDAGATLDEVYAAKPTPEHDAAKGDNRGFTNRAYRSLTHEVVN